MHRRIIAAAALALAASAGAEPPELDFERLIEEALAANPGLKALEHRTAAAEARVPPAGALQDPSLRLELSNVPFQSPRPRRLADERPPGNPVPEAPLPGQTPKPGNAPPPTPPRPLQPPTGSAS